MRLNYFKSCVAVTLNRSPGSDSIGTIEGQHKHEEYNTAAGIPFLS